TICTPRRPACALCPWGAGCAGRRDGDPTQWPVKAPKRNKPKRVGVAFVYWRGDGQMLFRQRPPRGLLGGMTEVPSSEWRPAGDPTADLAAAPVAADWRPLSGHVRHVFTHFELSLTLFAAKAAGAAAAPQGFFWHPVDRLETLALPSVMAKVVRHGLARLT
ncbi:MAG: NUDIX domain-containing protein, partial [Pseudomonadota bacterium]|nr:NUDIX domain-containing protein [Pseudomonadota bacterium]